MTDTSNGQTRQYTYIYYKPNSSECTNQRRYLNHSQSHGQPNQATGAQATGPLATGPQTTRYNTNRPTREDIFMKTRLF